jgi:hypothetical protein
VGTTNWWPMLGQGEFNAMTRAQRSQPAPARASVRGARAPASAVALGSPSGWVCPSDGLGAGCRLQRVLPGPTGIVDVAASVLYYSPPFPVPPPSSEVYSRCPPPLGLWIGMLAIETIFCMTVGSTWGSTFGHRLGRARRSAYGHRRRFELEYDSRGHTTMGHQRWRQQREHGSQHPMIHGSREGTLRLYEGSLRYGMVVTCDWVCTLGIRRRRSVTAVARRTSH